MFNPIIFLKVKILRLCKLNILTNYEMMLLALKSNTDPETLTRLADNKGWRIRSYVAQSPNTPTETLESLANDKNWFVLCYVAQNPNTPPEALARLADYTVSSVRYYVLKNPYTPKYIKEYLNAVEFMRLCYGS